MPQPNITYHPAPIHYFTEALSDKVDMDLVLIPAGSFLMSSPTTEEGRYDEESPQHEVVINSFFMGRTPVTQAQWRSVAELPPVNINLKADPARLKGKQLPVENVEWEDAIEFCDRLSRVTQRSYRLPSEAEWEYACRAGSKTPFHFGETIDARLANYRAQDHQNYSGKYGCGEFGEYREQTTPINQFPPNKFGLQDMHGNIWEWCQDKWYYDYNNAPINGTARVSKDSDESYVIRGGSWSNNPKNCRSAYRYYRIIDLKGVGFRVVCNAPRL